MQIIKLCLAGFFSLLMAVMFTPGQGERSSRAKSHLALDTSFLGVSLGESVASRNGAHVLFIKDPVPMSSQEIAKVDTTGMVKKTSGELTFFTYPIEQDTWVSASINETFYWEKDRSDKFCQEFASIAGKADFLDVGANIGTWSIPVARCLRKLNRGGSVIAIEALAPTAKHLAASIHANHLDNVNLFPYAVGEGGSLNKNFEKVSATNKGGSRLTVSGDGDTVPVRMTTLDAILKDKLASNASNIFAMKMDIENYELYALKGAANLLHGDHRPCLIQIELRVEEHEPSKEAMKLLQYSGYERVKAFSNVNDHFMRRKDFASCVQKFASVI